MNSILEGKEKTERWDGARSSDHLEAERMLFFEMRKAELMNRQGNKNRNSTDLFRESIINYPGPNNKKRLMTFQFPPFLIPTFHLCGRQTKSDQRIVFFVWKTKIGKQSGCHWFWFSISESWHGSFLLADFGFSPFPHKKSLTVARVAKLAAHFPLEEGDG